MESKAHKSQDFSKMKLSELIKNECDDSDSDPDINENNLLFKNWNDNYGLPESDITNSNINIKLENGAEETNVNPIDTYQVFSNYKLVGLKPIDNEYKKQKLKTTFEFVKKTRQNYRLFKNWNDNRESRESNITNSNINTKLENGAKETNVNPIDMYQAFSNYKFVGLKPIDDECKNFKLKTTFEHGVNETVQNTDFPVNRTSDCITDKCTRIPKTGAQRSKEFRERIKAKANPKRESTDFPVNHTGASVTGKRKRIPKTAAQRSKEYRERIKAKADPEHPSIPSEVNDIVQMNPTHFMLENFD